MKKYVHKLAHAGLTLLTLAAFCGITAPASAQTTREDKFTLTNGNLWWFDGTESSSEALYPDGRKIPIAKDEGVLDANGNPTNCYISGTPMYNITHIAEQGGYYLTLDTSINTTTGLREARVGIKATSETFTPNCAWSRTGYTGYYYQEWVNPDNSKSYRSYLIGTRDALEIYTIEIGAPNEKNSIWFNWDFGAAVTNVSYANGVRSETNHWLYFDNQTTSWKMSADSYERPETIIYNNYHSDPTAAEAVKRYYYGYEENPGANDWHPYGNGALFMPVTEIVHGIVISDASASQYGLKGITLTAVGSDTPKSTLRYSEKLDAKIRIERDNGLLTLPVIPAYTEYVEETRRKGINLNYRERTTETFGSNGIATTDTYYYKNGKLLTPNEAPTANNKELTFEEVTYSLNNSARRFLQLEHNSTSTTRPVTLTNENQAVTVDCYSVPTSPSATLTAVVKYSFTDAAQTYYVFDTVEVTINLDPTLDKRPDIDPTNAPVVMGYVCGGGRMANVGHVNGTTVGGNPTIRIHNTDSIWAVYGGNDIAGWVQGQAEIYLGSMQTIYPMKISYVYGGGCGYYTYEQPYDAAHEGGAAWAAAGTYSDQLTYGQYCFKGTVYPWKYDPTAHSASENEANWVVKGFDYSPWTGADFAHNENGQGFVTGKLGGTIPYIKTSEIYIGIPDNTTGYIAAQAKPHDDLIQLDTVFGGAENAFIGIDGDGTFEKAISINMYGGSVMAMFGGNNYGGSVAKLAHVYTTVHNTKTTDQLNIENTYFTGYGRDFGVRHLYGGGNMVESAHAQVTILGGMIDTCFVGGNQASVVQPVGTINCRDGKFIYDNPSIADILTDVNPKTWSTLDPTTSDWRTARDKFLKTNPGAYREGQGRYNVRVFFGGNNKAPMANLSYIHLASGGVGYLYGGGNQGDMMNTVPFDSPFYVRYSNGTNAATGGADTTAIDPRTGLPAYRVLDFGDSVRGSLSANGWTYDMPISFGSMVNAPWHSTIIVENIYGGCRMANVLSSSGLSLSGGVFGYVNGGCDISGDVGSKYDREGTWVIVDSSAIVLKDAFGGSNGFYHCHDRNGKYTEQDVYRYPGVATDYYHEYVGLPSPTQNRSNIYINGGNILHAAYGGGVMCDVGFDGNSTPMYYSNGSSTGESFTPAEDYKNGSIHFLVKQGTIGSPYWHHNAILLDGETNITAAELASNRATSATAGKLTTHDGNIYGGGYLSSIHGLSYFHITGGKIYGSVFAGNDCMGSVNHFGKYHYTDYSTPTPTVVTAENFKASDGTTLINGDDRANFSSYLLVEGEPRIACIYGGGNGAYNYHTPERPEYSDFEPQCMDGAVDNRPKQPSSFIDIHTAGGFIDTVFGGGNGVGVDDNVRILFNVDNAVAVAENGNSSVGTIFGGNNRDDMPKCVPYIDLHRGIVDNVYGGGNAGSMGGKDKVKDRCNNDVTGVSTYVYIASPDVIIKKNVFGGCRMADVSGMAYIDIRNTHAAGVQYVYGGNDIAGTVTGNTRIDISGGTVKHIWGGSNGYYQYQVIDPREDVHVYPYNYTPINNTSLTLADTVNAIAKHTTGEPYVDSTTVNLFGGNIDESVYGGGRMGDCRSTTVVVDNQACFSPALTLNISGSVFGGGEGDWTHLDKPHRGNTGENTTGMTSGDTAVGATHVHLKSATNLSSAIAYGGGKGGDAYNTYITTYDTWSQPFNAIYGGCWGSDVRGTTHVILNGTTLAADATVTSNLYTARNVYGGNDFTGNVYASHITVNSGTYGNIYGAGDGYGGLGGEASGGGEGDVGIGATAGTYAGLYAAGTYGSGLTVPNTEYVDVNINDCRVTGNLYGGGKLGTTWSYQKDAEGAYVLVNGKKVADTTMDVAGAYADPEKYSYVIVNIHGGIFDHNVFGGGSGVFGGDPLIYGLKIVNMDGGIINQSLYGGSANVSDGYRNECIDKDHTTQRPSSVINLAAGNIKHHVFAGGYMGSIYGSGYINVGIDAIDDCSLWTKNVKVANAYALFRPGATDGHSPAFDELTISKTLTIGQSIYAGPNWGTGSGEADFSKPGVYGGETRIFIDGNEYNTGIKATDNVKPTMIITDGSVIGAGTSVAGGDVYSRIDIRNYGGIGDDCAPTREIKAVQRANGVWLNNTAIEYTGTTDASTAYLSTQLTFNRLDTLNTVGYNVIDVDYAITNVAHVRYFKGVTVNGDPIVYPYIGRVLAENTSLVQCHTTYDSEHSQNVECKACDEDDTKYICNQLDMMDRDDPTKSFTALLVNDGINIDFISVDGHYSPVEGYAFLLAPKGTNAIVTARTKYGDVNSNDGGFMSVCSDSLQAIMGADDSPWNLTWCGCILNVDGDATTGLNGENTTAKCMPNGIYTAEYPYYNYNTTYRVWSLGNGTRRRFAVVQAHSNTDNPLADNKEITLRYTGAGIDSIYNLAIAHSVLRLPPTTPGHYYKINPKGIVLEDENEEMRLVDQSYLPDTWEDEYFAATTPYVYDGAHLYFHYIDTNTAVGEEAEYAYVEVDKNYMDAHTSETYYERRLRDNWGLVDHTGIAYVSDSAGRIEPAANGEIRTLNTGGSQAMGINYIYNNSNTYFGLMMMSGEHFKRDGSGNPVRPMEYIPAGDIWYGGTTISGNSYVNVSNNFSTALVDADNNASPTLDLYMLYDNRFSHTILGTVKLELEEYDQVPGKLPNGTNVAGGPGCYYQLVYNDATHIYDTVAISDASGNFTGGHTMEDCHLVGHNLNAPIEVEISLATILEEFTNMEYEVVAMYNEGRTNTFSRKVVLPATLQTRQVFLESIQWAPTDVNGNWLGTASDPQTFYLTDKEAQITGADVNDPNRFGLMVNVTDNVSNNLTTSVGWYEQHMTTPTSLYTLAGYTATDKKRVTGTNEDAYYDDGGSHTIYSQPITPSNPEYYKPNPDPLQPDIPLGESLGILDGRGEAAMVVTLNFDGNRIYPNTSGKGYVGKAVLNLVSYNTQTDPDHNVPNRFTLTINVKTRAHGDTIYLATANSVTRGGMTMTPHTGVLSKLSGKSPDDYLHTFYEAFTGPYQEGDVIAILDEVEIKDGASVFIQGQEYMPVQVIRYSGHHHIFPGEKCAYRGPMITVSGNNSSFTARCITFNGSMLTKTKPIVTMSGNDTVALDGINPTLWRTAHNEILDDFKMVGNTPVATYDKYADTLKAHGPIIRVKDNATVVLQNRTTVTSNYNIHEPPVSPATDDLTLYGAINVTNRGLLQMINNIDVVENISMKIGDTKVHPLNGAVYVNGGTYQLLTATSASTAIKVNQNLLINDTTTKFWKLDKITIKGLEAEKPMPVHYSFGPEAPASPIFDANELLVDKTNYGLANVYLTRTPMNNPDDELSDNRSDMIYVSTAPTAGTKIGISKWFPGPTVRDTIQIVYQSTATQLREAVYTNQNFFSDDDHYVFYNYGVDNQRVYLQRCATFNFQQGDGSSWFTTGNGTTADFRSDRAVDYKSLPGASCPTGGDTLICRLQGGFFPYTYTWYNENDSHNEAQNRTTAYTNLVTNTQIASGSFTGVKQAVVDTLVTPPVSILPTQSQGNYHYTVEAQDVTGNCVLKKEVTVRLVKDISGDPDIEPVVYSDGVSFPEDNWSDNATNAGLASNPDYKNPYEGSHAKGVRTYNAIKITPYVSPNTAYGNIKSIVNNTIYDESLPGSSISNLSFCEGDVIRLAATPASGTKFVMWDFSPYYSTPTTYVVPSASTSIIAYFSPADYWIDVVNDTTLGGVAYNDSYIYSARPTVPSYTLQTDGTTTTTDAGYVTTYNGDVHIYNENGLAWFISVVNGLNGTQARPFFFNTVYLHDKTGGYDMSAHKWTPVGTQQHRFRGAFVGVGTDATTTEPLDNGSYVSIKHLIVNEPDLNETGMFAFLDSARVQSIQIEASMVRGAQYVGAIAANAVQTNIVNCAVIDSLENESSSTTVLTTHYVSGGMLGKADRSSIERSKSSAKYAGDAVYSGGMVGYATGSRIYNNYTRNINRMNAVYMGGAAGYADASTSYIPSSKRTKSGDRDGRTYIKNNYIHYVNEGHNQRVGGTVGYSKHTVIENNYVYGQLNGESTEGGVGAVIDEGTMANHNYYESTSAKRGVGQTRANAVSTNSSDFSGQGNQVKLGTRSYGVDNLTRVLNIWVREQGGDFLTWRSDLENANHGYPLFGTPDMIPVSDSLTVTGCDSVEWDGITYLFDDEIVSHFVDSVMMVDSTFTLHVMVNHATREQVEDSVNVGYGYTGHGFELTETEVLMLYRTVGRSHSTTIVLTDTLQTAAGCDSIVTLMLTINPRLEIEETPVQNQIKVYPNPTTSRVTVEATEAMSHVELYDNHGRRLESYNTHNSNDITIDVSHYPAGAYYLRVHTADNITIQKLIKK